MTEKNHLYFHFNVGMEKHIHQGKDNTCPFCSRESLSEIIDEEGSILLVKNKYQTFDNTDQTVLIETSDHNADITTYDIEHLYHVITFGINHWLKMEESGNFKSVVFYKNHGPLSGGTINHAHMQIVGLESIDYRKYLSEDMFEGIEIYREDNCILNISTKPKSCATEYNIITTPRNDIFIADQLQIIVKHILKHCNSFNVFFYQWKDSIICKILPRYVTSPFLIGFSIPQTFNDLHTFVKKIKNTYYQDKK